MYHGHHLHHYTLYGKYVPLEPITLNDDEEQVPVDSTQRQLLVCVRFKKCWNLVTVYKIWLDIDSQMSTSYCIAIHFCHTHTCSRVSLQTQIILHDCTKNNTQWGKYNIVIQYLFCLLTMLKHRWSSKLQGLTNSNSYHVLVGPSFSVLKWFIGASQRACSWALNTDIA